MNKNLIIGIAVVVVLAGGAWVLLGQRPTKVTNEKMIDAKTVFEINIKDFTYNPASLTVKAGETVKVTNMDLAGHSVTADNGSFDSGVMGQNESKTFVAPSTPGSYPFHCVPHPSIKGILVVE